MNGFIADRELAPIIDRTFPFDSAMAAYDYLRSGQHFGKVVISLSQHQAAFPAHQTIDAAEIGT